MYGMFTKYDVCRPAGRFDVGRQVLALDARVDDQRLVAPLEQIRNLQAAAVDDAQVVEAPRREPLCAITAASSGSAISPAGPAGMSRT